VAAEEASQTSENLETTTISDREPETISATTSISLKTESITNGESSPKETQSEIKKVEVEADAKEQKGIGFKISFKKLFSKFYLKILLF